MLPLNRHISASRLAPLPRCVAGTAILLSNREMLKPQQLPVLKVVRMLPLTKRCRRNDLKPPARVAGPLFEKGADSKKARSFLTRLQFPMLFRNLLEFPFLPYMHPRSESRISICRTSVLRLRNRSPCESLFPSRDFRAARLGGGFVRGTASLASRAQRGYCQRRTQTKQIREQDPPPVSRLPPPHRSKKGKERWPGAAVTTSSLACLGLFILSRSSDTPIRAFVPTILGGVPATLLSRRKPPGGGSEI